MTTMGPFTHLRAKIDGEREGERGKRLTELLGSSGRDGRRR